jgi:hypothetical protein
MMAAIDSGTSITSPVTLTTAAGNFTGCAVSRKIPIDSDPAKYFCSAR